MNISKNIGYKDYLTYTDSQKYNILIKREEEIEKLKELCDKYEEEHRTTYEIWEKDISLYNSVIDRIDNAINFIDQVLMYHLQDYKKLDEDCNTLIGILKGKGSNSNGTL